MLAGPEIYSSDVRSVGSGAPSSGGMSSGERSEVDTGS
jgi:hypothetical protein